MSVKSLASTAMQVVRTGLVSISVFQFAVGNSFAAGFSPAQQPSRDNDTATPIKHVIVIVGENRSFDHVFVTYVPKKGQKVWNLLSEEIVKADGTPGRNFTKAEQLAANDTSSDGYLLDPPTNTYTGSVLPAPLVGGPSDSYVKNDNLTLAVQSENGLPTPDNPYVPVNGPALGDLFSLFNFGGNE